MPDKWALDPFKTGQTQEIRQAVEEDAAERAAGRPVAVVRADTERLATAAIELVARHAIAHGAENIAQDGWDLYPEVSENDWAAVSKRMKELAAYPDVEEFRRAYDVLTERASDDV